MLGQPIGNIYNNVDDFKNHTDYLKYMYGSTSGFISRATINPISDLFSEKLFSNDWLINKNSYYNAKNVYTSLNSFISQRKGRKTNNLKRLNALYIDIDCYKAGLTQEQVLYFLEEDYFGRIIPTPTFIINSGRGLYLIYKINEDCRALPRWERVQRFLYSKLEEFGADPQALDASRVLRVPFTVNSKSDTMVTIERFNNVTYTLYEIIQEYDIPYDSTTPKKEYGKATERQKKVAKWQAKVFGVELPNFDSFDDTFEFIHKYSELEVPALKKTGNKQTKAINKRNSLADTLNGRVRDLFTLFGSLRKGENCCREYALFLCRLWNIQMTGDYDLAIERTLALNNLMDKPFSRQYVIRTTKSAETKVKNGESYNYSTSKIVEALQITEEEQSSLKHLRLSLKDTKEKSERNRKHYLKKLRKEGKKTKAEKIEERKKAIIRLSVKGKKKAEICEILNISQRTFERDYKELKGIIEKEKSKKKANTVAPRKKNKCTNKCVGDTAPTKIQPTYYRGTEYRLVSMWKTLSDSALPCATLFSSSLDLSVAEVVPVSTDTDSS